MSSETPVRPDLEAWAVAAERAKEAIATGASNSVELNARILHLTDYQHFTTASRVLALITYTRALEEEVQRVRFSQEKERVPFPLAEQEGLCPDRQAGDQGRPEEGGRGHG